MEKLCNASYSCESLFFKRCASSTSSTCHLICCKSWRSLRINSYVVRSTWGQR